MQCHRLVFLSVFFLSTLGLAATEGTLEESSSDSLRWKAITHVLITNKKSAEAPSEPAANLLSHENTLGVEYGVYGASINFSSRIPMAGSSEKKQVNLEKKLVSAEWELFDLKLGDTHQELGKGIALSLYRDDTFGIDNTLEGIALKFRPTDLNVLAFGGRINALRAPVALNPQENPITGRTVWLAGTEVKGRLFQDTQVGGHYLLALNQPDSRNTPDGVWNTFGLSLLQENILGEFDANVESNFLVSQKIINGKATDLPRGASTYASVTWAPDHWKVRLEGKDYRDYNFEFRKPPTLEEDVVETTNISDVSGARIFTEKNFEGTRTFTSSSYYAGYDRKVSSTIHHGVVATRFQALGKTDFEFKTGYRWMPEHSDLYHISFKTKIPTFKGQNFEIELRKQKHSTKIGALSNDDDRNIANLAYSLSERVTLLAGMEYVPTNDAEVGTNFFNVGARLNWGGVTTRAFLGQTSGGTQCSGGICRVVPAYTGALLDTVIAL